MYNFALLGAAGFIAPRHMKAIKDTKNNLAVACDKTDSVGILDSYFPKADFFTEFERFDRHIEKLKRKGPEERVQFVSICTPNYLHDAHIRFALRAGAHAICEKPLVTSPWNLSALEEFELEYDRNVYTILQLRLHPRIQELKAMVEQAPAGKKFDIDLTYITSRGNWYLRSWKGDITKSGGITQNIGIHFFDMLLWVFGAEKHSVVHALNDRRASGFLELEKARVRWFLSCDEQDLPASAKAAGSRTHRTLLINNNSFEFSEGFTDLHTKCYEGILNGEGFGISDARPSIELTHKVRTGPVEGLKGDYHPVLRELSAHL